MNFRNALKVILILHIKGRHMSKQIYEIVTMPNGLRMMSILPINNTGVAKAYCTVKDNQIGYSKGSCGPFSCNIYKKHGLENGIKDFHLCCDALGILPSQVITNRLTASTNKVRVVDEQSLIGYDIFDEPSAPRADGLITDSNQITLFHYASDCAICMFLDPVKKICGCIHASWRGSLIGIIEEEVKSFRMKYGSKLENIIAVLMPSISVDAFEVGIECAKQFERAGFDECVDYSSYGKPHVDFPKVNHKILLNCGLKPENVYAIDDLCTYHNEDLFHSFRRGPIDEKGDHLNGINGYFIKLK